MFSSLLARSAAASAAQPKTTNSLKYSVTRIAESGWLPVYRDYRRSNNMVKATIIRRVSGNSQILLKELVSALNTEGTIKPINGNIVLKGDHLHAVRDFLTARGL
ncbi:hypothetical protein HDU78_000905 [Chytriomyces hyalinus]|nr:hypothetical protein HDU78_000905 [Chytriomyces hyalinus]